MKARRVAGLILLLAGAAVTALLFVPGQVEQRLNVVLPHPPYAVPQADAELHARLQIADLHADTLMWQRDFLQRSSRGHLDLPRLQQGNVALQVLTTVTRSPRGLNYERNAADAPDDITALALVQRWPPRTWGSLAERALYQAARLDRFVERADGVLMRVRTREDLASLLARRASGENVVGAVLGTEGSHALDDRIDNIARLHAAGFRIMGLQHFFDNALGGSLHGASGAGLSEFGREAITEMRRFGVIVDLAHSSTAVVEQVLALDAGPVMVSHTGLRSLCPGPRNIPDELLQRIAARGGIVGIGFWKDAICDDTPAGIATTLAAAVRILGADAVALGSDYDGATTVRLDASELAAITSALLAQDLDEATIAWVMGGNALRFLGEYLPAAAPGA